jgi:tetratricopeptide (TPR) repeat protein
MSHSSTFPHDQTPFLYPGKDLARNWALLHRGDCEPFPDDPELQEAWRCFHRGDFLQAIALADDMGIAGHAVANKATGIFAMYLEDYESRRLEMLKTAIERAESAIEALPDDPNSHYFHAFNLGRYSQSISIVTALKQGVGSSIARSLASTLALRPDHAEAHIASGLYHAEIIDKVGKMVGAVTYGASEDKAIEHFEQALDLIPQSPIAHIEYANGLYLLYGERRIDDVSSLYEQAVSLTPRDAMEKLDIEAALQEFE